MLRRPTTLVILSAFFLLPCLVVAQVHQSNPVADRIAMKVHKLDLLNQILPVLMTKDQIKKLLPVVEKARDMVRKQEAAELEQMKKYEGQLDGAISDAMDKKQVTKSEVLGSLRGMARGLEGSRMIVIADNTELVRKKFVEVMNAGQVKAAANALDPRLIDPNAKVDSLSEDDKLKLWIRAILLDPMAYDLLVDISK